MPGNRVLEVKRFLWSYCRPVFLVVRHFRRRRREKHDLVISRKMKQIEAALVERHGSVVNGGPFQGMKYLSQSHGSALAPKLIGSYEAEISAMIEEYCAQAEDAVVVDIGCDEGYYAVGMALRLPRARVYAFDINSRAQNDCARMAALNGVQDRVIVGGECTWELLEQLLRPRDLVICDCEGCEAALMDPEKARALANVFLIVELHDSEYLEMNITPTLISRFRSTHDIELVDATKRVGEWPAVQFLNPEDRRLAVDEGRTLGQQYALMRPKQPAN